MRHAVSAQNLIGAVYRFASETGSNIVFNEEFGEVTIETEDEQVLMAFAEPTLVRTFAQKFMIDGTPPERIESMGWTGLWDA